MLAFFLNALFDGIQKPIMEGREMASKIRKKKRSRRQAGAGIG